MLVDQIKQENKMKVVSIFRKIEKDNIENSKPKHKRIFDFL